MSQLKAAGQTNVAVYARILAAANIFQKSKQRSEQPLVFLAIFVALQALLLPSCLLPR